MRIPVSVRTSCAMAYLKALVDSGATDCFMSPAFIKQMKLGTRPLQKAHKIWNIDNTENKDGLITHYVNLNVQTKNVCRDMRFLITNIGNEDVVLRYLWCYNPMAYCTIPTLFFSHMTHCDSPSLTCFPR